MMLKSTKGAIKVVFCPDVESKDNKEDNGNFFDLDSLLEDTYIKRNSHQLHLVFKLTL